MLPPEAPSALPPGGALPAARQSRFRGGCSKAPLGVAFTARVVQWP